MKTFAEIHEQAARIGPRRLAIAGRTETEQEQAIETAARMGLASATVFPDAVAAVRAVRAGQADLLMKGNVETRTIMAAVLDREQGLRSGRIISHITVVEALGRLLLLTDCGICLNPTLTEKADIIRNALPVARRLGLACPRVAVLAAIEKVNPKMPETVDAEALSRMDIPGCIVQGPLALDNAVSPEAARLKGIGGAVAGRADILLVPSVVAGNLLAKAILYFAGVPSGGVVAGTACPVAFLSRADAAETHLHTIALGVICS